MKNFKNLSEDAKAIVASNLTIAAYLSTIREQIQIGAKVPGDIIKHDQAVTSYYSQVFDLLENDLP